MLGARFAGANLQSPSTGILPLPAPTGGEGRGGKLRSFRGMGKGAETPTKAEAGKLKRNVCFTESVRLLWRERVVCVAGIAYPRLAGADAENPRGSGTKESLCQANEPGKLT